MGKSKPRIVNPSKEVVPVKAEPEDRQVGMPIQYRPASLIDKAEVVRQVSGLPDEWNGGETLAGFPPSVEWRTPGDAIFGEFIDVRTEVGPNKSRLYDIAAYQGEGKDLLTIGIWGTTAIDRLFDSAYPPVQPGDKIGFIYLGEKETQRGMNPVKLFSLKLLRMPLRKTTPLHSA